MRNSNRKILVVAFAVAALAIGGAACQSGGGDVNAHNIAVTVNVPKALATSAAGIGVVYVGIYAGIDSTKGYPSPVTAPAASSAGDDAFPFGGTSIGDFQTRDARDICRAVADQTVTDAGDHWAVTGTIYQFPWVKGQKVWAFADRYSATLLNDTSKTAYQTCDPDNGYSDNFGVPIQITAVTQTNETGVAVPGPYWTVQFAATPISAYFPSNIPTEILDVGGQFYQAVETIATNGTPTGTYLLNNTAFTVVVSTPVGTTLVPKSSGGATQPRLELNKLDGSTVVTYGTQFQNILNFPSKYIDNAVANGSVELISSTPAVLDTPSDVTITLDQTVP